MLLVFPKLSCLSLVDLTKMQCTYGQILNLCLCYFRILYTIARSWAFTPSCLVFLLQVEVEYFLLYSSEYLYNCIVVIYFSFTTVRYEFCISLNVWIFFELILEFFPSLLSLQINARNVDLKSPLSGRFQLYFLFPLLAFLPIYLQADYTGARLIID